MTHLDLPSLKHIKDAAMRVVDVLGKPEAIKLIREFDVNRIVEIDEIRYPDFIAACDRLIAERSIPASETPERKSPRRSRMKTTHTTMNTSFEEVEPLFNQVRTSLNCSEGDVLLTIGYSKTGNMDRWRRGEAIPVRVKYALLGLLSELKLKPAERVAAPRFDFGELAQLFAAVLAVSPVDPLLAKIAREMTHKGVRNVTDR
jgi:hypothetical protein